MGTTYKLLPCADYSIFIMETVCNDCIDCKEVSQNDIPFSTTGRIFLKIKWNGHFAFSNTINRWDGCSDMKYIAFDIKHHSIL